MKSSRSVFYLLVFLAFIAASPPAIAQIELTSISYQINMGANQSIDAGDEIYFEFLVLNNGDNELADVSVDTGNSGVNASLPTPVQDLSSGEEVVIASYYNVRHTDLIAGRISLVSPYAFGRVEGCEFFCDVQSPPLQTLVIDLPRPDLSITKSASAGSVVVGDEFSYLIEVRNVGTGTAYDVIMTDGLPAGLTLLAAPEECSGTSLVQCSLGDLPVNDTRVVELTVVANEGSEGVVVNQACVEEVYPESEPGAAKDGSSLQYDPIAGNDCDSVETTVLPFISADLSLRKSDSPPSVQPGAELTYTMTVRNSGPDEAVNVYVSDTLPGAVTFVDSTCSGAVDADCSIGTLAAGGEYAYSVTVVVSADASGELVNSATVSSDTYDPNTGNNSSSERTTVVTLEEGADLRVSKAVDNTMADAGSELIYTITVTNAGPDAAANVVMSDQLPAGVTLVSSSCGGTDCELGTLQPGASVPVEIVVTIDSDAPPTVTNTASVTADTADPDTTSNSASASTLVNPEMGPSATFTVRKDFSDDSADSVQVSLNCTDAVPDQSTRTASEGAPAVFNLSEVGAENRCTATEVDVPDAYQADASACSEVAAAPQSAVECTIVNNRLPDETTLTVNVSLGDPDAQVDLTLTCTDATIADNTLAASNDSPAVFTLSNVGAGNTCSVEASGLPDDALNVVSGCEDISVTEGGQAECQINSIDLPETGLEEGSNPTVILDTVIETCPRGTNVGGFQEVCNGLVGNYLGGSNINGALSEITPDDAASIRSSGMQTTNVQVSAVDGRLGTLRGGGGAGFSASGFSMAVGDLAMSGSLLKSFLTALDQNNPEFMQANAGQNDDDYLDEFGRWGIWVSGRLVVGDKDRTSNQIDYDFETAGLTFGMDYRFTDELVAGIAVGYADTSSDLGVDDGDVDTQGYSMSLYGTWFQADRFYLSGSLGYGSNDYDQRRILRYNLGPNSSQVVANVEQTLGADYSGSQYSATLGAGWDFNRNGWTFGPTLRIAFVDVDVDAYDETMLSSNVDFSQYPMQFGWAVHIDDQSYSSLQPSLGFEVSNALSMNWGVLIPQGYVEVVSELQDGSEIISGRFLGDTLQGNRFQLLTDDFEETFGRAGLGLGFVFQNNKSGFVTIDADFGRDLLETYYINAGFRWQF